MSELVNVGIGFAVGSIEGYCWNSSLKVILTKIKGLESRIYIQISKLSRRLKIRYCNR